MSTDNPSGIFPNEIISEILTKLPTKSIHRFKCVSKTWNSLISNPKFISSYISHFHPSWVFLDRVIQLKTGSTQPITHFTLLQPPKVSSLSVKPHSLVSDPITDPTHKNCPAIILGSSNGLLLYGILKKDPYKEYAKNPDNFTYIRDIDTLFVANPVTNKWVPLPEPSPKFICRRPAVGFLAKVDLCGVVEKFVVVEYVPYIWSNSANMLCFDSRSAKWVGKDANYMLGGHLWRGDGVFGFFGRFVWYDLSCGLIVWDEDPFDCIENNDKAVLRYITLPKGCLKPVNTVGLEDERSVDVSSGGCIQYMEVWKEGDCIFKVWRLRDFGLCGEGWSLMYNVSRVDFKSCLLPYKMKKNTMPKACFMHPFEADTAFFDTVDRTLSFDFQTRKLKMCGSLAGHKYVLPFVIPSWPTTLPPRFCSARAKEKGNEYFKDKKFVEAVKSYSESISFSPNAFAYANRALAYLKLNKFRKAAEDCCEALKLDSEYVKVYARRASARKELGNLKGAIEDIEYALKLEPKNQEMKKQHAELKLVLEKA